MDYFQIIYCFTNILTAIVAIVCNKDIVGLEINNNLIRCYSRLFGVWYMGTFVNLLKVSRSREKWCSFSKFIWHTHSIFQMCNFVIQLIFNNLLSAPCSYYLRKVGHTPLRSVFLSIEDLLWPKSSKLEIYFEAIMTKNLYNEINNKIRFKVGLSIVSNDKG